MINASSVNSNDSNVRQYVERRKKTTNGAYFNIWSNTNKRGTRCPQRYSGQKLLSTARSYMAKKKIEHPQSRSPKVMVTGGNARSRDLCFPLPPSNRCLEIAALNAAVKNGESDGVVPMYAIHLNALEDVLTL